MKTSKIKKRTVVEFLVIWQPKVIDKVSEIMARCDLGIVKIEQPVSEKWGWITTATVDRKYINKMKRTIKKALEATDRKLIKVTKIRS